MQTKKSTIILLVLLFVNLPHIFSQEQPKWVRYSAISPDGQTIVFSYKGDLYKIPASGGNATPLTFHHAHDYMPVWSPDGNSIAFASDRYGNFDIYVLNLKGGEPRRLTFHSRDEIPCSFSADNKIIYFGSQRLDLDSHRQYPTSSQPELYSVPAEGGRVKMVFTFPAEALNVSKSGKLMVYHDKKGGENEWRKHHTSSIARDIWIYDSENGEHKMLTSFKGEDRNPVFTDQDKSIFFLSEESGSFNIHKLDIENPKETKQISFFKKFPVRNLSTSQNGMLCFSYDGELYTFKSGQAEKVKMTIHTEPQSNKDQNISINGKVREMAISPNGKEIAFISRGEVFVTAIEGSMTKRITNTTEQERFVSFSADGIGILYASERNGKWQIFQTKKVRAEEPYFYASTLLNEETLISNDNDNYQPKLSPDGKELAFIENRAALKIYNFEKKQSRTILTPKELFYMSDGDQYFEWSPDNKWLLIQYSPILSNSEVVLINASGNGKMINLTESGHNDFRPQWANKGKQMLWFSTRDGLRSYANSGSRQSDVYSMFFTQESWDRYNLSKEDYALLKDIEEKEKEKQKKAEEKEKEKKGKKIQETKKDSLLEFDWENLTDRKARLTLSSANYSDVLLAEDGEKLYYLARFDKNYNLWSINLRTKETKMELTLDIKYGRMEWDKEMKNIFLLADGNIAKINLEKAKKEPVLINGEMTINQELEYKNMFDHIILRTEKGFYSKKYHGINWDENGKEHAKYLQSINNPYDFTEMISEMLGELNSSHSGARYRPAVEGGDHTASLGIFIDYEYSADGIKIKEVIKGGPLDKAKFKIKEGFIIEQIDGQTISANLDYSEFLNRKENKYILLQIVDPSTGKRQQITVKPISLNEENNLLYKRWVLKNQEEVERLSKGQLGYVHIPGMSDGPYRKTYEEMMGKYHDRKGIIVDTRFNGGGDLVSDLAMFFTGKRYIDYCTEDRTLGYEPAFRWTKPTVALFNEANYSDGHCFACGYQQLEIGKTIGMPVPGTCSFAGWEVLQDESILWGMVPVSAKDLYGKWMENLEISPDIIIKNQPGIISKGRDEQLERAVEELLKLLN